MSSAGENFEYLTENKMKLVSLQYEQLKEEMLQSSIEHEAKLKYMAEEHASKLKILNLELEIKKLQLNVLG